MLLNAEMYGNCMYSVFLQDFVMNRKFVKQHLIEIKIFCNIINEGLAE